jgi:hypothetical protein
LGAVLYEMVTGRRAFDGESAASVSGAILKDTPPTISRIQPPTPPALDQNAGQIPLEAAGLGTAFQHTATSIWPVFRADASRS